jgi:hypothetical protein
VPSAASVPFSPSSALSGTAGAVVNAAGATVSTVTDVDAEADPTLPAMSVRLAVTSNVPSPCAAITPREIWTVALPARTSAPVTARLTTWPPQFTNSVSPASAARPVRSTTTPVPFEASLALIPPALFSATPGAGGAGGATVSTETMVAGELAPMLPIVSVRLAVTLNSPSPCAVIVSGGTVTPTLPARMSPAVRTWLRTWLPQFTVSVSPATAPVPERLTSTTVPSAASAALMPPAAFSATVGAAGGGGGTPSKAVS